MNVSDKTSKMSQDDELDVASEMRELLGLAEQAEHQSSLLNSNLTNATSFLCQIVDKVQMLGMGIIQNAIESEVKFKQCNSDLISLPKELSSSNTIENESTLRKYSTSSHQNFENVSLLLLETCNKLSHQISNLKSFSEDSLEK